MVALNPNALLRDDADFIKNAFAVSLGVTFENYRDQVLFLSNNNDYESGNGLGNVFHPAVAEMLNDVGDDGTSAVPVYFTKRKCRTAFLGGNDAINPLAGYCRNDDIAHPFTTVDGSSLGMGRVYSEEIDDKQQILYVSCGIPDYNNLGGFYKDAFNATLGRIMNSGPGSGDSKFSDIGELVGSTAVTFMALPVMPLVLLVRILQGIDKVRITKYFDFTSQMPVYYRMVNSILTHLAVNMGLANDANFVTDRNKANAGVATGSNTQPLITRDALYRNSIAGSDNPNLPTVFAWAGFDMFRISMYKYLLEGKVNVANMGSTDQALEEMFGKQSPVSSVIETAEKYYSENFASAFKATLYDAQLFLGIRVSNSTGSSETISNTFGMSELANTLNSKLSSARSINFMSGGKGDGLIDTYNSIMSALTGFWKGASDTIKLEGIGAAIIGAGQIDIPEVWQGSTFSKSYDFNMELNALYGDPVSIMQDLYVPLACVLAMACPRATGAASFTTPFLIRAYCKGMFAVPMGAIDNVTITRGADTYGWNMQRLPLQIKISFTIRDLSPAMYPAIASTSVLDTLSNFNPMDLIFGQNSNFQEYLLTLSGMGLYERLSWYEGIKRRISYAIQVGWVNWLSPFALGTTAGRMLPARVLSTFLPSTNLPRN